ncbi:hypothetical protein [Actinomadura monticuli]|uniref:Uncharacterized protein n=1 Tax=Actinomadura monticuli TaxID=3097367 RepID=A0ABV4QC00_9ACTN
MRRLLFRCRRHRRELHAAGFTAVAITPTGEAGGGLHAATVHAVKPTG